MSEPAIKLQARDELGRLLPGNSGNPKGRPKTCRVKEVARELLESNDAAELSALCRRLLKDDPKTLLAYAYGKPVETVALQDGDGNSLYGDVLLVLAQAHVRGDATIQQTN